MLTITQAPRVAPDPDTLPAEDLLAELRGADRERTEAVDQWERLAGEIARRTEEHEASIANARQFWGSNFTIAPLGDPEAERLGRDLAETDAHLPAIDARRVEVIAALRRRVTRYEAAIAAEGAAIARAAADVAERQERLHELWAPLGAFEGLPAEDPPIAGATRNLALGLVSCREQLAQRERMLARLRAAVAGA